MDYSTFHGQSTPWNFILLLFYFCKLNLPVFIRWYTLSTEFYHRYHQLPLLPIYYSTRIASTSSVPLLRVERSTLSSWWISYIWYSGVMCYRFVLRTLLSNSFDMKFILNQIVKFWLSETFGKITKKFHKEKYSLNW